MILICQCKQAGLVNPDHFKLIREELDKAGIGYTVVDDLCGLAAGGHDVFSQCEDASDLIVLACYPRAVRALFHAAGASLPDEAQIENLRTAEDIESIVKQLISRGQAGEVQLIEALKEWIPWFPAIDPQRCKNCKLCLSFCLFGVYAKDDSGKVRVVRPDQCKTNCPACSRVCPYAAIVFPKYHSSPIQGDTVDEAQWKQREVPSTLQERLSNNIYTMLRKRSQSTAENIEDLKKLQKTLDIPDEVIEKLE